MKFYKYYHNINCRRFNRVILEGTYINIKRLICHHSNSFYFLLNASIYNKGDCNFIKKNHAIIKEHQICINKKRKTSTCYNNKLSNENQKNEDIIVNQNESNKGNLNNVVVDEHFNCQYIEEKMFTLITAKDCEQDNIIDILNYISNHKFKNKKAFVFFLRHLIMLSQLYKDIIIINDKIYNNSYIINYIKECVNFIIISRKDYSLNSLFKYFDLLCTFHINDMRLIKKIFYLILCNKNFNDIEEKVIYAYYIIQHLYNNNIFNKFIAILLTNKLLLKINFLRFKQTINDTKNDFLIFFLYYIMYSLNNNINKEIIIQTYVTYYNNMLEKNIQSMKNIVNLNILNQLQHVLLISQYYDSHFNNLIKKNIQTYFPFLNIYDIILVSTNIFLNFTTNNEILLCISTDENIKNKSKPIKSNHNNNNNNTNNNNIVRSSSTTRCYNNSENGNTKHFKNYYHNFLSLKYLSDSIIRSSDNYISSLNYSDNIEYVYKFLVLTSYCHFTLYANWWADTSIYFKLKKKTNKQKKVLRSRLPYTFHLQEKISHLLDFIFYNSSYSNESEMENIQFERGDPNKSNIKENININENTNKYTYTYKNTNNVGEQIIQQNYKLSECNNNINYQHIQYNVHYDNGCINEQICHSNELIKCKSNIIDIKYLTYVFKSFIRISLFNPDYLKKKKKFILLLKNSFIYYINSYIYNYENEEKNLNKINDTKYLIKKKKTDGINTTCNNNISICNKNLHVTHNIKDDKKNNDLYCEPFHFNIYENDLSLYEISSLCECFFLVEYINNQHLDNINNIKVVKKNRQNKQNKQNRQNKQNSCDIIVEEEYIISNCDDIFEKNIYIFLDKMNRLILKKKLNLTIYKEDYIKNVLLKKFVYQGDIFFNYYLLLRLILPLLFNQSHNHYILLTKRIIIHILSLIFHKNNIKETIDENINNNILDIKNIINNYIKWEDSFIYINNQRRIRKQTKMKRNLLDFIYTGEFIRPSSILILCLYELKKYDDLFEQFIINIFKHHNNLNDNKEHISKYIDEMYEKTNALVIDQNNKK
ncbi:conserved Plasmodium protein, unknown function [Plasmodium sp. DRC-Itaito]|nr:conserved Plasmodium protein, unknown function [Plasmodium sp. DRC-Itaito]